MIQKNSALVVASGRGERAKTQIPKQYVTLNGKSVLDYTVQNLCNNPQIHHVLCVISQDMVGLYNQCVTPHSKLLNVTFGGNTRQESVFKGLSDLKKHSPHHVLIHDAVRPNVCGMLIDDLLRALDKYDGACPAIAVTDSLRKSDGTIVNRDGLFTVQTPQAFHFDKILTAHEFCLQNFPLEEFTDDIAIAQRFGLKTHFTTGSHKNFKLTYPSDFDRFEQELKMQSYFNYPDIRTANGYDVHRLTQGDGVILGGIKIECPFKLLGHSDADVVLHAITDALLGTIAAQDIGYHFSPNDDRWKGADSAVFLRHAHDLVLAQKGRVNFVDVTIICEAPKISPYRDAIRQNIADILNLPIERISLKATTTEKLGFTGRGEGIAAQACVTVVI